MKTPKRSEAQILLAIQLKELGFEKIEYEYQFHPLRKWRADVVVHDARLLLECDGGIFSGGHKRATALEGDYEKQNCAQMLGYKILRFSNRQVISGDAKKWIAEWMAK